MAELQEIVSLVERHKAAIGKKKLAVVAPRPVTFGVARQFQTLAMYLYEKAFGSGQFKFGYASAIAWSLFLLIAASIRLRRFGPMEWVWRSLTQWQKQPMPMGPRAAVPAGSITGSAALS